MLHVHWKPVADNMVRSCGICIDAVSLSSVGPVPVFSAVMIKFSRSWRVRVVNFGTAGGSGTYRNPFGIHAVGTISNPVSNENPLRS